jgi:hypothetical protein
MWPHYKGIKHIYQFPQNPGQRRVAFISIPPYSASSNDYHGVEHEDAHFSVNYVHSKIPGCKMIKKYQLRQ